MAKDYCALAASIDDATRGMSGLKPWSPPPTAAALGQHPDAELFAAIERYYAALNENEAHTLAWDKIELLKPRPRGWKSKERAYLRSMNARRKAEDAVAAVQAKTMDGLIAKAKAASTDFFESEAIKLSIAEDALMMAPSREVIPPAKKLLAEDEKLVALGEKFEPLLDEYYTAHKVWSDGGKDPSANWAKLSALSKAIKKLPASSAVGLRAHALVAFWEVSPLSKGDTTYSFDDAYPFQMLFSAVADFCGLRGKVEATGYQLPDDGDNEA
jgi:hypothetical protein